MALVIYTEVVSSGQRQEFQWYVGQERPNINRFAKSSVIKIQADGDELIHIQDGFQNIPYSRLKRVQVWFEPWARFIYDNL